MPWTDILSGQTVPVSKLELTLIFSSESITLQSGYSGRTDDVAGFVHDDVHRERDLSREF
jgi:hypothetical protein